MKVQMRCQMRKQQMNVRALAIALATLLLSACAGTPGRADDPFEPVNRAMYAINKPIDDNVMRPIAQAYVDYVPKLVRQGVSNVFGNIDDLFSGINGLLQGKTEKAGNDFGRVLVNFWGLGGLIDIASDLGIPKGNEDFGQTFGYWGIPQGPYLFVPLWGPTTVRDGTGSLIRIWYGPVGYIPYVPLRNIIYAVGAVDLRAGALGTTSLIDQAAIDPYAFVRRAYLQRREYMVYDGNPPPAKEEE
jgi:phospholipid-binding lipoprotein MlaA